MHSYGICDQREVASLCGAFRQRLTLCYGFSDQLISFAALGFQRLGRCSACQFPKPLLTIPPVKEIKTGPGIPDVTVARAHEGDEFPASCCVLNFLDDANASDRDHECRQRRSEARFGQMLGVHFSKNVDTKKF